MSEAILDRLSLDAARIGVMYVLTFVLAFGIVLTLSAPSQITKRAPTKRLKARRAANSKPGYFPNPAHRMYYVYNVNNDGTRGPVIGGFVSKQAAKEYARAWSERTGLPCLCPK